jgi:hypothetical protein
VNRSIRHVSRSPLLRLMAAFAWLMLVAMPAHPGARNMSASMPRMVGAISLPMPGMGSMAATATRSQHDASTTAMHADCCCDQDGRHGAASGCHCATGNGTVLAAAGVLELPSMTPDSARPFSRARPAPDIVNGPPLRPPAV